MSPPPRRPYAVLLLVVSGTVTLLLYDAWRDGQADRLARAFGAVSAEHTGHGAVASGPSDAPDVAAPRSTDEGAAAAGAVDPSRVARAAPREEREPSAPRPRHDPGPSRGPMSLGAWGGGALAAGFGFPPRSDGGLRRDVALWRPTEAVASPLWKVVQADLAAPGDGPYAELGPISSQPDLLPVGDHPNPATRLWEFVVEGTGRPPRRDAVTGRYTLTADSAIVVVLVPGTRVATGAPADDDPGERPLREVSVPPFYCARTETTVFQWQRLRGVSTELRAGADEEWLLPATGMTRGDVATALAPWALRLPTEAEWEAACGGGRDGRSWSGDDGAASPRMGFRVVRSARD